MEKFKKLFTFKIAKRAIIVSMLLMILYIIIISFTYNASEDEEIPIFIFMFFYPFGYLADEVFNLNNTVAGLVLSFSPFVVLATASIKLYDYISVFTSSSEGSHSEKAVTPKRRIPSLLGLIVLPAWSIMTGFIFLCFGLNVAEYVLSTIHPDGVLIYSGGILTYSGGLWHKLLLFIIMFILSILPTLCVFTYSLLLDIHGLRFKSKTIETNEAPV